MLVSSHAPIRQEGDIGGAESVRPRVDAAGARTGQGPAELILRSNHQLLSIDVQSVTEGVFIPMLDVLQDREAKDTG